MNRLRISLSLAVLLTASCASPPTLVVTSSLGRHDLKGKTLAVGGFTAQDLMTYPGQTEEETIVNDAGTALQHHLKHSHVLTAEAAWAAAGPPPIKMNSGVAITLGHKLTRDFIRRMHSQGVDYLLWIDLVDNSVDKASKQWLSTQCTSSTSSSRRRGAFASRSTVTEYNRSESASRSLGAAYSLLDTAHGKPVWRAESLFSRSNVSYSRSTSGYPPPPRAPLPPMESKLMQRMTAAVIDRLPR